MTKAKWEKFLQRDPYCWHCGTTSEDLVPHHRANRGMGGSKARDVPSNIIAMCSLVNGLMESDPATAARAREYGWKISTYADPQTTPVFDATLGLWFTLDNYMQKVLHIGKG